ncbi:alpha/beta fold hydrolase [Pseudoxanthomonas wuyuanensis]|uniref:Pimeloyl-ACP methyl ester carboxylesterase n=1 Tax=Pseudoxanthomonas wuyuanensis TaxID=1073196 RepID=A0A286D950_9GAMM|nr:alpha/beta hydrolase [Pseudoxanthomonas wuyuanensis]KAF1722108.1 alpha/beta hydrolase [Pseudoxanthomonas wuyuanensis]SOD55147.1 Pimeloyl-ACP methyl ester carboxylesterase [Pseudoxanthomonas wuyuanensis]
MAYQDLYWRSSEGLRLHARDYAAAGVGAAKLPVLCVPGLTRNSADFGELAERISAQGRRVLALDLRGRAGSEYGKRSRYRPPVYADDVLALMRQQAIPRAVFIGTSLGVLVTMTVASKRRDAVAAAVLNDAGPEVSDQALARIAAYAGKPLAPMSRAEAAAYIQRIAQAVYPRYGLADWEAMVERTFRMLPDGRWVLDYDPAIVRTINPWVLRLLRPLLWRSYRKLARGCPTLLVRGETSDILGRDLAQRMVAAAPGTRLVEVPEVGHAPSLSEPEARAAIADFLDGVE